MAEPERPLQKLTRSELIEKLGQSRMELGDDLSDLRESLSVSRRVEGAYQRHLAAWLGASLVVGFLISRPLLRPKKRKDGKGTEEVPVKGLVAGTVAFLGAQATSMVLPALKIALTSYLGRKLAYQVDDDTVETVKVEPKKSAPQ